MINFYNYIRQKFSELSSFSGRPGDPLDDLAVKPTALVISQFYNLLVQQKKTNDITRYSEMSEDELDLFGGRSLTPRIQGNSSSVVVRIYFDYKQTIDINDSVYFITSKGYRFIPEVTHIDKDSFLAESSTSAKYYVDVFSVSESTGYEYNIKENEIVSIEGANFVYKSVTNLEAATFGSTHENNETYAQRLLFVNDRSMFNKNSVISSLKNMFPEIVSVYVCGAGNPYMVRDLASSIDTSEKIQVIDYLGKRLESNLVPHKAFYGIFPPNAGSAQSVDNWGPHSSFTKYTKPLTIDPLFSFSDEAAYLGFPLDQEANNTMYQGIYFQDQSSGMIVKTNDLLNVQEENAGILTVIVPSDSWKYGGNGLKYGNFGNAHLDELLTNFVSFTGDTITFSSASEIPITIQKDISKRTGIKASGRFVWPDETGRDTGSSLQFLMGGIDDKEHIYSYTGIGFGIISTKQFDPDNDEDPNVMVYFANSLYGEIEIMISQVDLNGGHVSLMGLNSLAETAFRIQPGIEYEFEFFLHSDLTLSIYLKKTSELVEDDPLNLNNELFFMVPRKYLSPLSDESGTGILSKENTMYGTDFKITLNSKAYSNYNIYWEITNLKISDTNPSRAMALFAMNVGNLDGPASIYANAFGSGAINNILSNGYNAFIWDKDMPSQSGILSSNLTKGGWSNLTEISNPDGNKFSESGLFRSDINDLNKYTIDSIYGKCVFILFISNGTSQVSNKFNKNGTIDVNSTIIVDYIKVESQNKFQYHTNNKCDIYLSTFRNSNILNELSVTLDKADNDAFFLVNSDTGFVTPIHELYILENGRRLSSSDFSISYENINERSSSRENIRIYLNNINSNTITVVYKPYLSIDKIQQYYENRQVYGDILIKHKYPCYLDMLVTYSGNQNINNITNEIKTAVDETFNTILNVKDLIKYLEEKIISIKDITITYRKYDDNFNIVTGETNIEIKIRDIDFFKINNLSITKI